MQITMKLIKQMSTRVVTPPTAAARVAVSNLGRENAVNQLLSLATKQQTNSPLPGSSSGFIDMNMAVDETGH